MNTWPIGILVACLGAAPAIAGDWQEDVAVELSEGFSSQPALFQAALDAQFRPTRAGFLRTVDPILSDPAVAPLIIQQIGDTSESLAVRYGWADALVRYFPGYPAQGAAYGAAWVGLIQTIEDEAIVEVLLYGLKRADLQTAVQGVEWGSQSNVPAYRDAAMATAGWHPEGHVFSSMLITGLADSESSVRGFAARSLGWLGIKEAKDSLTPLLTDKAAIVRLEAVRALQRIDED